MVWRADLLLRRCTLGSACSPGTPHLNVTTDRQAFLSLFLLEK